MEVYQIMEYRSSGECISWGIYSSEKNARIYLLSMGWENDNSFKIIPYELDKKLKNNSMNNTKRRMQNNEILSNN